MTADTCAIDYDNDDDDDDDDLCVSCSLSCSLWVMLVCEWSSSRNLCQLLMLMQLVQAISVVTTLIQMSALVCQQLTDII